MSGKKIPVKRTQKATAPVAEAPKPVVPAPAPVAEIPKPAAPIEAPKPAAPAPAPVAEIPKPAAPIEAPKPAAPADEPVAASAPTKKGSKKKAEQPKAPAKKRRVIKLKETAAEIAGIGISVARVKNMIANISINKDEHKALMELIDAEEKVGEDGTITTPAKNVATLSDTTKAIYEKVKLENIEAAYQKYIETKIRKMPETEKKAFHAMLKKAKEALEAANPEAAFNVKEYIQTKNPNFFKEFTVPVPKENESEATFARKLVSKLRMRFSGDSKLQIAIFVEYFTRSLIEAALRNTVKQEKRMVTPADLYYKMWCSDSFIYFPMLASFDEYRKNVETNGEYKVPARKTKASKSAAPAAEPAAAEPVEPVAAEPITEPAAAGEESPKEFLFKGYVTETCRSIRLKLSKEMPAETPDDANPYMTISISNEFREFCSNIIVELATRLGKMLYAEITAQNLKTITKDISETIITHVHLLINANPEPTKQFILGAIRKYEEYLTVRRESRPKKAAASKKE